MKHDWSEAPFPRGLWVRTQEIGNSPTRQNGDRAKYSFREVHLCGYILIKILAQMSKVRVVIVPGNGGGDVERGNWYGWLRNKLTEVN